MSRKDPWMICPSCEGKGASPAYLGKLTQDRLQELGADWVEDYRKGIFDRECQYCDGTGKVHASQVPAIPCAMS